MTLSFSTEFKDGSPTEFVERIWDGLLKNELSTKEERDTWASGLISPWGYFAEQPWEREIYAKIHTLRQDKENRWRAGLPIHFVVNNRTPQRRQFAPIIFCTSIQKFKIEKELVIPHLPKNNGNRFSKFHIWIDDEPFGCNPEGGYDEDAVEFIAHQDGFLFYENFMDWWPVGVCEGKIIHWTPFRY